MGVEAWGGASRCSARGDFNETFKRNCIINGVAPLAVSRADSAELADEIARDPSAGISVDLENQTLHVGPPDRLGHAIKFDLDPFYAALLIGGQTEDDMLGALQNDIDRRCDALAAARPWLWSGGSILAHAG